MRTSYRSALALLAFACVSTQAVGGPVEDCVAAVIIEGSFMGGRIFKGKAFIPKGNQQEQMKKIARTLVREGLTLGTFDKDLGILTASYSKKAVGARAPQTTTFSMTFDQKKEGLDASATLSTPAGVTTNEGRNKKDLCELLLTE